MSTEGPHARRGGCRFEELRNYLSAYLTKDWNITISLGGSDVFRVPGDSVRFTARGFIEIHLSESQRIVVPFHKVKYVLVSKAKEVEVV